MIPALVLTAGLATRLRPLSLARAKAALPLGGVPIAAHILTRLSAAGVRDAVLNLHHLPESIASRIGDGSDVGVRVRYSWEVPEVLGSAGGPRKALSLIGAPRFLIVNGDTLTNPDIAALIAAHEASGALVTMAVVPNTRPDRYGGLAADADGAFTGVVARGSATPSWHFIGVQVVDADAFVQLDEGVPAESVRSLYPALVARQPGSVRVHPCTSSFLDIGTAADYVASCRSLAAPGAGLIEQGARVRLAPTASVRDTIAWDDVEIGEGAGVDQSILTDGVVVPPGSRWRQVILRRAEGARGPNDQQVGSLYVTPLVL